MPPTLSSIDHIHVFVANRHSAKVWYEEVMGLTPITNLAFWARDGGPLTLSDAGGKVHIALFESPPLGCRSTIALGVDAAGFLAWQQHLGQALGRTIEAEDHAVSWSLYFNDPDGNPYEITTYEHAAVAQALLNEP